MGQNFTKQQWATTLQPPKLPGPRASRLTASGLSQRIFQTQRKEIFFFFCRWESFQRWNVWQKIGECKKKKKKLRTTPWSFSLTRAHRRAQKMAVGTHECPYAENKNTQSSSFFPSKYFPALLFLSSLSLCLLSPLKIMLPSTFIIWSAFSYLSPLLPLLLLLLNLLFFHPPSPPVIPPFSSCFFHFFSGSILCIPLGFLRGRTPLADQGQTLLQCSLSLNLFFALFSRYASPSVPFNSLSFISFSRLSFCVRNLSKSLFACCILTAPSLDESFCS